MRTYQMNMHIHIYKDLLYEKRPMYRAQSDGRERLCLAASEQHYAVRVCVIYTSRVNISTLCVCVCVCIYIYIYR